MYLIRVTGDGQLLQESIYLSLSVEITLNYKQFNFNLDFYTQNLFNMRQFTHIAYLHNLRPEVF